ncbi:MAG: hypothetical protein H8K04_18740 [Nitrospira sp.]
MKSILMTIMAVAVAVTFSAPSFAGEKKEEKKGGKVVESIYAAETFSDKKEEKKGGKAETFSDKKEEKKGK